MSRMMLFLVIFLMTVGNIALIAEAFSLKRPGTAQIATPYPAYLTSLPPAKQTRLVAQWQTQQALALTPSLTGTHWVFSPYLTYNVSTAKPLPPPIGTPAGDGVIEGSGNDNLGRAPGINYFSAWAVQEDGKETIVFAGVDLADNEQGKIYVISYAIDGRSQLPGDANYITPDRAGPVHIVGAQGERLVLLSTQGETYYFDVPGRQFTTSLTASVLTVTPYIIPTMPTVTPTFTGDAPHNPDDVFQYSPVNTPLHLILSQAGEEQWFRFKSPSPGTIQVHLTQLSADYDLYVYSVARTYYSSHDGQSTNPGTADELVTILNAPPDDYMVRVVGVKGAFDPMNPYQLEFDVHHLDDKTVPVR